MNDEPSRQDPAPSREFVPDVKPLEGRCLLSSISSGSFVPLFPRLPRTGGVSAQMGTLLAIGVGQPTTNAVQVIDDHAGQVQADWNGGPVHSSTGITTIIVQAERARTDQITFNLTSPRTSPTAVMAGSLATADVSDSGGGGHPFRLKSARTSGTAVQTGSLLTVTVDRPRTNLVQITNGGSGAVQVEWNGMPAHSFSGVATIVVDTRNAVKDQVTLTDQPQ